MNTSNASSDSFASTRCDSKDSGIAATISGQLSSIFPFCPTEHALPGTLLLTDLELRNPVDMGVHKSKAAPHVDVLNDFAEMILGTSSFGGRSMEPTLSPKENIHKLKSTFFGCSEAANAYGQKSEYGNCRITEPVLQRTQRKNDDVDRAGKCALTDQKLVRTPTSANTTTAILASKKHILFTSNNSPDKLLAKSKSKTNTGGFKPISAKVDSEIRRLKKQSLKSISSTSPTSFNRQLGSKITSKTSNKKASSSPLLVTLTGNRARNNKNGKCSGFQKIRTNKYSENVVTSAEVNDCSCEKACDENCLNRLLQIECDVKVCKFGTKCQNTQIQKHQIGSHVQPFKTTNKGWGVRTTKSIEKGIIIFEYVGEVIIMSGSTKNV